MPRTAYRSVQNIRNTHRSARELRTGAEKKTRTKRAKYRIYKNKNPRTYVYSRYLKH